MSLRLVYRESGSELSGNLFNNFSLSLISAAYAYRLIALSWHIYGDWLLADYRSLSLPH